MYEHIVHRQAGTRVFAPLVIIIIIIIIIINGFRLLCVVISGFILGPATLNDGLLHFHAGVFTRLGPSHSAHSSPGRVPADRRGAYNHFSKISFSISVCVKTSF